MTATKDYLRDQPIVAFEGKNAMASKWSYNSLGFGKPKKGQYYLSGAIVEAWRAPNDLDTVFEIVEPVKEFKLRQVWVPANGGRW